MHRETTVVSEFLCLGETLFVPRYSPNPYLRFQSKHENGNPGDFAPATFSSRHTGGAIFGLCDGSVHFISDTIETGTSDDQPDGTFVQLIVRNDGQVVGEF